MVREDKKEPSYSEWVLQPAYHPVYVMLNTLFYVFLILFFLGGGSGEVMQPFNLE